ncbi:10683_t:CDS:2 [Entrophospora sp. SA101]|nr:10683_t:CDS:2 [Entrophospora sp. SA101]
MKQVQELKNKNEFLSYKEFLKTYESDDKVKDSYNNEVASYGDISNKNKSYGPAASYFTPIAPITITATVGAGVAGVAMMNSDNETTQEIGSELFLLATDSVSDPSGGRSDYNNAKTAVKFVRER